MKAISLWQPWATLIAIGVKRYETRSWPTTHRGLIAIHAAKSNAGSLYCRHTPIATALRREGYGGFSALPLGSIVAVGQLVGCVRVESIRDRLSPDEREFGNFGDGRWAWELSGVRALAKLVPFRGAQGLFVVPKEVADTFLELAKI